MLNGAFVWLALTFYNISRFEIMTMIIVHLIIIHMSTLVHLSWPTII